MNKLASGLKAVVVLLTVLMLPCTMAAQAGRGVIVGTVTDTANAVLQGARVDLSNGLSTVSDSAGNLIFTDVPAATYALTVNYVGFDTSTQSVTVTPGQITNVNVALKVASTKTEMTVYADRQFGEAEAINRERTSDNILNVLPADVITSLPNANVADAIGRLPSVTLERDEGEGKYVQIRGTEPRLSNVTINGIVIASPEASQRQVKLDIIPSELVESVEINKTLSANQDADAIGGSVNLVTKNAPEEPFISINGYGGFTAIQNYVGLGELDATVGHRFLNKKLGVMIGGAWDWNGRGIDDIEPAVGTIQCDPGNCSSPSPNAPYFPTYSTMDIREYSYYRSRWGFAGGLDYKLNNEGSGLYLRGLYSHFDNFGSRWVYTPTINSFTDSPLQGGTDGNMSFNAQIRRPVQTIGSLDLGGRHIFGSNMVLWSFAASRSLTKDQGYSSADFFNTDPTAPINNVQYGLDVSNPHRPKFVVQNGVDVYDPTQYYLQDIDSNHTYSPQLNLQGAASYAKNFRILGHFSTFEMGGLFRNAHKFQNSNDVFYNVNDPTQAPMTMFLGTFRNPNYYFGSYKLGPMTDYNKILNYFFNNSGNFSVDYNQTQIRNNPNNYDLIEQVSAGYLMDTIDWNKFNFNAGVRFEGTSENVKGYHVVIDSNGNYVSTQPLQVQSSYLNVLPSVQLRYALTSESGIRLAYWQGIARPNFGDLPPYVTQDDKKQSVSVGNPYLKATRANDYDIQYEHYLKPLGAIRGGFFYKSIYNPIYFVDTTVQSGPFAGFTQTQPVNGTSADLWGIEVSYIQQLTFLPGFLNGGGVSANYSYTHSNASGVPNRTGNVSLQRQAPNTWNISPTWDHGRISVRVGITHNDANIFQYNFVDGAPLGPSGPNGDVYLYGRTQIDAQGTVRIAKGWSAMLAGLNLSNAAFGFYQGSGQYPIQREYYGPSFEFGFRWLPGAR